MAARNNRFIYQKGEADRFSELSTLGKREISTCHANSGGGGGGIACRSPVTDVFTEISNPGENRKTIFTVLLCFVTCRLLDYINLQAFQSLQKRV